jgi:glycyl-tRNA synthetase
MLDAYDEEVYTDPQGREQTRVVAHFHKNIAPIKFAVMPLMEKKQELVDIAEKIFDDLSEDFMCEIDLK